MVALQFDEIIKVATEFGSDVTIILDIITNSHNVFVTVPAKSIKLRHPFDNMFGIDIDKSGENNYFSQIASGTVLIPYNQVKMIVVGQWV